MFLKIQTKVYGTRTSENNWIKKMKSGIDKRSGHVASNIKQIKYKHMYVDEYITCGKVCFYSLCQKNNLNIG